MALPPLGGGGGLKPIVLSPLGGGAQGYSTLPPSEAGGGGVGDTTFGADSLYQNIFESDSFKNFLETTV